MKPEISVIIPSYQHGKTIAGCVRGVLAQQGVELEVVVVNDGSTDQTKEALKPFEQHERVTVIHQENRGSNPTRNRGFEASTGDYVMFLDADAQLSEGALALLKKTLEEDTAVSYAYGDFAFGWKRFKTGPFDPVRLRALNYIHTSALIRRSDFPGFDEDIKRFQDWDLWLTMLNEGHVGRYMPGVFMQIDAGGRAGIAISSWLPKSWYKAPWKWLPWIAPRVRRYEAARERIVHKHGLN